MKYEDILIQYGDHTILCVYDESNNTKSLYIAGKNDTVIDAYECQNQGENYTQTTKHLGLKLYEVMRIYKRHNAIYFVIEEK